MYLVDHFGQPFLKEVILMFAIFGLVAVLVAGGVVIAENHGSQQAQETTQEVLHQQ